MIYNPVKYFRLKRKADIDNWVVDWVNRCLKDESISPAGKVQLLTSYYEHADKSK